MKQRQVLGVSYGANLKLYFGCLLRIMIIIITDIVHTCFESVLRAKQLYQSISGEILPNFYVKNSFLAQKLTKLEHFKEIPENFILKCLKIQQQKNIFKCLFFIL